MAEAVAPHPYRALWETRDLDAWERSLASGIVLHSPIITSPFSGIAAAMDLTDVLMRGLPDFTITQEYVDGERSVFFWTARAAGRRIEGNDLITVDADGKVTEITVWIRTLVGIAAFAAAIGPPLAAKRSRGRALLTRLMIVPLRIFLAVADVVSARLVQRR